MRLVGCKTDYVTSEEHLSASSTRSKRNAKARVEEYLASIGKQDLLLADVDCPVFVPSFLRQAERSAVRN